MKDSKVIHRKVINYMYQSLCNTIEKLPFSGQHWLDQFVFGIAQHFIDDYKETLTAQSVDPITVCQAYIDVLSQEGFLVAEHYQLKQSGDNILVYINNTSCVYREFSSRAQRENLPYSCVRLGTLREALRQLLGLDYSCSVKIDLEGGTCCGKLYPNTEPKEEIVTRQGHELLIADRRAVLLPQEVYASLLRSVKEHAPHVVKHVLFDAGYQSGQSLAVKTKTLYADKHYCLQMLLNQIEIEGLGKVELVSFDLEQNEFKIRCYDSFQVAVANIYGPLYRTPQVICDLLRGIFAAYFTVLIEKEMICEEMACQAMEGNYCEFLVMPLPPEYSRKEANPWPK